MRDAQTLFREGVIAIRDAKDFDEGRRLLIEAVKLDPYHEMAWIWLSRTTGDPLRQRQCLERALAVNPQNEMALTLMQRLAAAGAPPAPRDGAKPAAAPAQPPTSAAPQAAADAEPPARTPPAAARTLTPAEEKRIKALLNKAQRLMKDGKPEAAIANWVQVLHIQVDHELALGNAVRELFRMKYMDDVKELLWRALNAGTQHTSIYLTAINILKREGQHAEADTLRRQVAALPTTPETVISDIAAYFIRTAQPLAAREILEAALKNHPKSQKIVLGLAELSEALADHNAARLYYERAARMGLRSKEGRLADKKLDTYVPALTDRERGSLLLALREALGVAVVFVLMAWQDAGLNLLALGSGRLAGVALGGVGGYLLVTATSSPQQRVIARALGAHAPPSRAAADGDASALPVIPEWVRAALGASGLALLVFGLLLVFHNAIRLITDPTPAPFYIIPINEVFRFE